MNEQVKVIILRTAGTNCNEETAFAFRSCGAWVDQVHIHKLFNSSVHLKEYHILAIPGGFTYGDDIESGRILANELRLRLGGDIRQFIEDGKLMIGICNGFQVLVKAGLLPGPFSEEERHPSTFSQRATLVNNDSGHYEDRWVYLKVDGKSVWTRGIERMIYIPVAHGEGKFVPRDQDVLAQLQGNGQVAFRYCGPNGEKPEFPQNPNGSVDDIAGITDKTGRILGLMPHPERHFVFTQHPSWTRLDKKQHLGDGAKIFENGVQYVRKNILKTALIPRLLAAGTGKGQ
ncbi:MAG TPA: phosphoribosylformylglycinamidine synthase I [Candidatus Omnitrophica bacterium]|nr:MAG: phosphoribosylformylglycinamidine synthase I [Omnitrophica WOR_2 bacterium GWA2_45_18]OGX18502.1 MAG: phosphoribosylformylglycinamidine synthase I [Omnitrophica WOR_2 bacterium GWC2_45_7]HBR14432.1 phosphoribosylformylglycinamidine synthase I [Candidatus Omnitrophota bacterium]